ncbi:MAG TPA: hypothetical protein VJ697_08725 [Nitrososphaeraceae archaeon]|nr:hypothetical protein [Nitrososphaeraceae archaeon]
MKRPKMNLDKTIKELQKRLDEVHPYLIFLLITKIEMMESITGMDYERIYIYIQL